MSGKSRDQKSKFPDAEIEIKTDFLSRVDYNANILYWMFKDHPNYYNFLLANFAFWSRDHGKPTLVGSLRFQMWGTK